MHTKEDWRVDKPFGQEYPIYAGDYWEIARTFAYNGEQEANAQRIVDCVNGCKGIEPSAVKDLYEALGELCSQLSLGCSMDYLYKHNLSLPLSKGQQALAKAGGK